MKSTILFSNNCKEDHRDSPFFLYRKQFERKGKLILREDVNIIMYDPLSIPHCFPPPPNLRNMNYKKVTRGIISLFRWKVVRKNINLTIF